MKTTKKKCASERRPGQRLPQELKIENALTLHWQLQVGGRFDVAEPNTTRSGSEQTQKRSELPGISCLQQTKTRRVYLHTVSAAKQARNEDSIK